MKVLVCGGRTYGVDVMRRRAAEAAAERALLILALNTLLRDRGLTGIIHGAASGADTLAGDWAWGHEIGCVSFKADWKTHGPAAGPIRNQLMLDHGKPDLVVAFPGGDGTADMVRRARKAGVDVWEPGRS